MRHCPYAIITACKNEGQYISELIRNVTHQTMRPVKWVIIDDDSSDNTYELARNAAKEFDFIEVHRTRGSRRRSFSSQVFAQQLGYEILGQLAFDFIAFLDADIQLPHDYYERILANFLSEESLAVAGGLVVDKGEETVGRVRSKSVNHHVPGGVQCFRRRYYDEIGGYQPIEGGGQDTVAEIMCMMRGGQVRSFLDTIVYHLRPSEANPHEHFQQGQRWGRMCYNLGYHPVYYALNIFTRFLSRPLVRLAAGQAYAFLSASLQAKTRPVSNDFVKFIRQLQMRKLRAAITFNQRLSKSSRKEAFSFSRPSY